MNDSIFGYSFKSILDKQQGKGELVPVYKQDKKIKKISVICFGCCDFFFFPETLGANPWPVSCTKCGHIHSENDAKSAFWPVFKNC